MTFKLFFQNRFEEREFVKQFDDFSMAFSLIHADLHARNSNFKSYYTRSWQEKENEWYYDVGSHSEFYVIVRE